MGQAGNEVELFAADTHQCRSTLAIIVAAARRGGGEREVAVQQESARFARRTAGDDIDDAAGAADTLQRVGAVDHFDAFDHRRIDGVRITRTIAQRRGLRHAVDHVQDAASAHAFAIVGHLLARRGEGRDLRGQHARHIRAQCQLLLDVLAGEHGDGVGHGGLALRHARGGRRHGHSAERGRGCRRCCRTRAVCFRRRRRGCDHTADHEHAWRAFFDVQALAGNQPL
ncbi:hypothetical protein D3C72_1147930 [compost metagenome]